MKKLLLIELNEINFDLVKKYIQKYPNLFPNLKKIMSLTAIKTTSETSYHELEPWIQWVSVHTGKKYNEHKVFRLGDIVSSNLRQIFEKVESLGFSVGVISAMNAKNALKNPLYFVPDPWTDTATDGSFLSNIFKSVLNQTVNDNTQSKITLRSIIYIFILYLRFIKIRDYPKFISLALSSRGKSWRKALFLDLFIHKVHLKLMEEKKPDFSTVFLNAGAHIQHHYLFNSEFSPQKNPEWYIDKTFDPFKEMLEIYDQVLADYITNPSYELMLATGLSQKEFEKPVIYWRLNNHKDFLDQLGLKFSKVSPRMTRDFLIEFDNHLDLTRCNECLSSIKDQNQMRLFGEIDKRELSLFVTLTYPFDLKNVIFDNFPEKFCLQNHVSFVAIKNGEHSPNGRLFSTTAIDQNLNNEICVTSIHDEIHNFFAKGT